MEVMAGADGVKVHLRRQMMKPGCHQMSSRCDWLIGWFVLYKWHADMMIYFKACSVMGRLTNWQFPLRAALNKAPLKVNGNTAKCLCLQGCAPCCTGQHNS